MKTQPLTQPQRLKTYRDAKKVVMIDFDGTLCTWAYPAMLEPEPGAREFMQQLFDWGMQPVIWSCRMSPQFNTEEEVSKEISRIGAWCYKHDIPYHSIDTGQACKALCLAYVDDRGVGYRGDFEDCLHQIHRMMVMDEEKHKAAPA